jgi:DNA-directed RNA polymerase specialized sigma24 family protein
VIDDYKIANRKISIDEVTEFWYEADFAQELDNKDKIREIFNFFETLNAKHKQILIMRIWDDLSFKEISELTWESVDNCKKIVSRTMIKLGGQYMWLLFILLFV